MNKSSKLVFLIAGVCVACGAEGGEATGRTSQELARPNFGVDFAGCSEFAGIGYVPRQNALPLVPAKYTLAGDSEHAVLVVRAVRCDAVAVDAHTPQPTTLVQIGLSLSGADPDADINNYALWYVTDQALLAAELNAAGADAEHSEHIAYAITSGVLDFSAQPARAPEHGVHGPVVPPSDPPVRFRATWWRDGQHGTLRMSTLLPAIRFGGASMTLMTPPDSELAKLVGGTSLTFPLLDSYNTFSAAHMDVAVAP